MRTRCFRRLPENEYRSGGGGKFRNGLSVLAVGTEHALHTASASDKAGLGPAKLGPYFCQLLVAKQFLFMINDINLLFQIQLVGVFYLLFLFLFYFSPSEVCFALAICIEHLASIV